MELLPTIKQRQKPQKSMETPLLSELLGVYSICSSSDYHPGKCQLLVVREDWQAKGASILQERLEL